MKVPLSWLKEYLNFTQSPEQLAEVLTLAGIEVEGIEALPLKFSGVVIGHVLEVLPHPSADRLRIAKVSDGKEEFQVVCGASNCRAGLKTAFAKIGATLTDEENKPFKIKKGKLRDVESFGMLCSSKELGLGEEEEGIMELSEKFAVGSDLAGYYSDVILDLSLTPNLGHCMSIYGIARELSAHLNLPLQKPTFVLREDGEPIEKQIRVDLIDKRQCPRYACRMVKGVQVGASPNWLKRKIEACGLRSINNVVDVGNFVMLAWGQPLHLFDYAKIEGKRIIITAETSYSELKTLDGIVHPIPPESLLICDGEKPLAFAGIMGSESSAVSPETRDVLIEAAYFTPQSIRKTSRLLGLKSDSSQRFEKGIDVEGITEALDYAAFLLQKAAGGEIAKDKIVNQAHVFEKKKIVCRPHRVNQLIGTELSTGEITSLLKKLGIEILEESAHQIWTAVPTFRNDLNEEIDLIEEVARVFGYNNIPKSTPYHISSTLAHAPLYFLENTAKTYLIAEGLQEFITCDLISPTQSERTREKTLDPENVISVLHPASVEQSVLRTSLLPGLLQIVKYNWDHGNPDIAGFEVGRVHFKEKEEYLEPSVAGIVLSGKRAPHHFDPKPAEFDFFDLKGIVENVLAAFQIHGIHFEPSHLHNFHPGRQAKIKNKESVLGVMGEVHPQLVKILDVPQRIFFAEINLHLLSSFIPKEFKVSSFSPFPGSKIDWTITLREEVPIDHILQIIRSISSRYLQKEKVMLLDLYKSEQIGKDKKNATFRFFYQDKEKTIASETVEKEHARIVALVVEKI